MEINFNSVLDAFTAALELIEDEEQRKRTARVIQASRASVERSVQDLLAGIIDEVNEGLEGRAHVDLRYEPTGFRVDIHAGPPAGDEADEAAWAFADGDVEKLTLRIPVELKDRAAGAAKEAGLSVNAWFIRLLARELRGQGVEDAGADSPRGRRRHGRHGRGGGRGRSLKGFIGA